MSNPNDGRSIPVLDDDNNVIGWKPLQPPLDPRLYDRPKLYLLRHPKTGKVVQAVFELENIGTPGIGWVRDHLADVIDSQPALLSLRLSADYDVVIV